MENPVKTVEAILKRAKEYESEYDFLNAIECAEQEYRIAENNPELREEILKYLTNLYRSSVILEEDKKKNIEYEKGIEYFKELINLENTRGNLLKNSAVYTRFGWFLESLVEDEEIEFTEEEVVKHKEEVDKLVSESSRYSKSITSDYNEKKELFRQKVREYAQSRNE